MNKRGWIHILEATIAVMIVAGVMMTFYSDQSVSDGLTVAEYSYSLQNEILDSITMDSDLRLEVLRVVNDVPGDPSFDILNDVVSAEVPDYFGHLLRVCNLSDPNDVCNMPSTIFTATLDKDVFVEEAVVSSDLGDGPNALYSPKKIRLFFWEGDISGDCYDECQEGTRDVCSLLGPEGVVTTTCTDIDNDGCLERSSVTSVCGSGKVCDFESALCIDTSCSNTCSPGVYCSGGNVWESTCVSSGGCLTEGDNSVKENCVGNGCDDSTGECEDAPCSDTCSPSVYCSGGNVWETTCVSSDGCLSMGDNSVKKNCGGRGCDAAKCVDVGTADLNAIFTMTGDVRTWNSGAGCYYNKCSYEVSVVNTGTASGVVWKRVLTGKSNFIEVYNQVVNPGASFNIAEKYVISGCEGFSDSDYIYIVDIIDDGGVSIDSKRITCSAS